MRKEKKVLIEESEELYYTIPEPRKDDVILFINESKKNQKWKRQEIPDGKELELLSEQEKLTIIERELRRRIFGVHMMINGELTYITGDHYFFLNYWYMAADTFDGFPEYRDNHKWYFYYRDLVDKDTLCFGSIFITQKRYAKTEIDLSIITNAATLIDTDCLYGMQSTNATEAKNNLFSRVVRSWRMLPELMKPVDSGETNPKTQLDFSEPGKSSKKGVKKKYKRVLNNQITYRPTLPSAYQGKRPRKIFLDEPPTIEEMDILEWWTTVREQLRLGKKIFGKASMPATVETMTYKGAPAYQAIWEDSDMNDRDGNGWTRSGLYRYFQPYWMGMEGFYDEYGKAKKAEIIEFVENQINAAKEEAKIKLKRQYPCDIKDVFQVAAGDQLESDCVEILKDHLQNVIKNLHTFPRQFVSIYEDNGELKRTQKNIKLGDVKEEDKWVQILEEPQEHTDYIVGIDGTNSDQSTSETTKKKSRFSIIVIKLFQNIDALNYTTVCDYGVIPEKMEDLIKLSYYITSYYNKFGRCKIMAESNVGCGPAVVSYFRSRGQLKLIRKQPKVFGVDNPEEKDKYTTYNGTQESKESLRLLNIWIRRHGRNLRSIRQIRGLLQIGLTPKAAEDYRDFSSAFRIALLGCGNFDPETIKKKEVFKKKPSRLTLQRTANGYELLGNKVN